LFCEDKASRTPRHTTANERGERQQQEAQQARGERREREREFFFFKKRNPKFISKHKDRVRIN
jgi:hypothetical protein